MLGDVPLTGGNSNSPVRRGAAVHREAGPWTPTIHALLRHLAARGVDWAPEPLGLDEAGREMLTFLPGEVPAYPLPDVLWSDGLLEQAGRLLRRYHDATADFPLESRRWQRPAHEPIEVVCHNDFAPYNFVLAGGRISGVIDFDMASPGPRAWDLAHLAYRLVPLAGPANEDALPSALPDRRRRLLLLCAAYGAVAPAAVLDLVPTRLTELAEYSDERAAVLPALADHARLYRDDARWVAQARAALGG